MNLSINPTYLCNFRCNFCYLTEAQLADTKKLDLNRLASMLGELDRINYVDLYGGELSVLPLDYQYALFDTIRQYYSGEINVVTNLSRLSPAILSQDNTLISVSYDFSARERHANVFTNMALCDRELHVLMLASPHLMALDVPAMVESFNHLHNVQTVEIKPYSASQANDLPVRFDDFERFVQQWIEVPNKRFTLVNELVIQDCLEGTRNAFSDDHIYITPNGKWAILEFDSNDREFFCELDHISDFRRWADLEYNRVVDNKFCKSCRFLGSCLSEHLRNVTTLQHSCNGFKNLLEWYEEHRYVRRSQHATG